LTIGLLLVIVFCVVGNRFQPGHWQIAVWSTPIMLVVFSWDAWILRKDAKDILNGSKCDPCQELPPAQNQSDPKARPQE
jgi:hypothetical protein